MLSKFNSGLIDCTQD